VPAPAIRKGAAVEAGANLLAVVNYYNRVLRPGLKGEAVARRDVEEISTKVKQRHLGSKLGDFYAGENAVARYGRYKFSATADPNTGKMKIALVIEGKQGTAVEIDTKKSGAVAAMILGAARKAAKQSDKPQKPRTMRGY
jgi:hypothetical protein